jgi:hypothetical protein
MKSLIIWSTNNHIIFVSTFLNSNLSKTTMWQNWINHFVTSCYKENFESTFSIQKPFEQHELWINDYLTNCYKGKISYEIHLHHKSSIDTLKGKDFFHNLLFQRPTFFHKGENTLYSPPLGCTTFKGCACLSISHLKLLKDFDNIFAYYVRI